MSHSKEINETSIRQLPITHVELKLYSDACSEPTQHDVSTASSLPRFVQPNHPQLRGFPEKDWVDPKLIICKLCLDRGQILEQLANLKYLEEIHGFRPK
jgi:hypothetical protein